MEPFFGNGVWFESSSCQQVIRFGLAALGKPEHFRANHVFLLSEWIMAEHQPGSGAGCRSLPLQLAAIRHWQNVFSGGATAE
jgi:hypothetical protein